MLPHPLEPDAGAGGDCWGPVGVPDEHTVVVAHSLDASRCTCVTLLPFRGRGTSGSTVLRFRVRGSAVHPFYPRWISSSKTVVMCRRSEL